MNSCLKKTSILFQMTSPLYIALNDEILLEIAVTKDWRSVYKHRDSFLLTEFQHYDNKLIIIICFKLMMNKSIDYFVVVQSGKSKNDGERVKMFASQFSLFLPVKNVNFSSFDLTLCTTKVAFPCSKMSREGL